LAMLAMCAAEASAQTKSGVDRLYILNCGEGFAADRWSPGADTGKPVELANNCYLINHSQGWLLWDTGVADAIAAMPDDQPPADPKLTHWRRSKTLAGQLAAVGVRPDEIKYLALSHVYPHHSGNLDLFPRVPVLIQEDEYEFRHPILGYRLFRGENPVTLLQGDHDVFGDGSVTIIATPGHTPGHQSLLVKLPKTGALVLSGDAVQFKSIWDNRRLPSGKADECQRIVSMQRIADLLAREKAQLWINHDKVQRDSLKMAPDFYE
jgi:N-acyl homoserine lactone hydrolase